jgi:hypothetical protein
MADTPDAPPPDDDPDTEDLLPDDDDQLPVYPGNPLPDWFIGVLTPDEYAKFAASVQDEALRNMGQIGGEG